MPQSRRSFVQTLGTGAAAWWLAGRGREASLFASPELDGSLAMSAVDGAPIIINSNENPVGPFLPVMDAVRGARGAMNRYPMANVQEVTAVIAAKVGVKPENILLGTGSTPLLQSAIQCFTAKDRPLVQGLPTFETPGSYARMIGTPITSVKLDAANRLDLDAMVDPARGAGVVYLCNPNNPVPTVTGGDQTRAFVAAVRKASPDTTILIDEAYAHYATARGYESMIPLVLDNPRVVVARTFSKAFGMAGLRLGFVAAHRDTIKTMSDWQGTGTVSIIALTGGRAAITMDPKIVEAEVKRNADVRAFTIKWFEDRGYPATDSQANFIFVDVKRTTKAFRDACTKAGVLVGRDFPPFATHCRITVGTMAEMQTAVSVFEKVLAVPAQAA